MTAAARRWILATLLMLCAAAASCSGDAPAPSDGAGTPGTPGAAAASAATLRLWRDLPPRVMARPAATTDTASPGDEQAAAPVTGEVASPGGPPAAPEPTPAASLLGDADRAWYRVEQRGQQVHWVPSAPPPAELELDVDDPRPWMTFLPVAAGEVLDLALVAGPVEERYEKATTLAIAAPMTEAFDPDAPMNAQDASRVMRESRQNAARFLSARLRPREMLVEKTLLADRRMTGLALYLTPPAEGDPATVRLTSLTLRRRGLNAFVAAGGELPTMHPAVGADAGEGPGTSARGGDDVGDDATADVTADVGAGPAMAVRWDDEQREGLLAPPPSRFAWDLPPHPRARVLELALGLHPQAARTPTRFRITLDGRTLLDETLAAPDGPDQDVWHERRLEFPGGPGPRRLEISTEGLGDASPLAFIGHPTVRAPLDDPPPNLVLISLDTLRPDRLGCYGGNPALSPRLDALAAESLLFENASSVSSFTLPTHASVMTGQLPAFHGVEELTDVLDPSRSPLLALTLARAGWVTAAFTGGGLVSSDFGFAQGFDRYDHNDPVWAHGTRRSMDLLQRTARAAARDKAATLERHGTRRVTDWLRDQPRDMPFFAFLHTYITHNFAPDRARLERHRLLAPDGSEPPLDEDAIKAFNAGQTDLHDELHADLTGHYDATIEMADEFVGRVLDALAAGGHADDTLVVVFSDHGEAFGEHGVFGHGRSLRGVVTRIPLIVHRPGRPGRRLDSPISLADLAPWLLDELGLEPRPGMHVRPPFGARPGAAPGGAPERDTQILALDTLLDTASNGRLAIIEDGLKLIVITPADGGPEQVVLFDLDADPGETRDIAARHPETVARLRHRLGLYAEAAARAAQLHAGGEQAFHELDRNTRMALQQLGYIDDVDDVAPLSDG